MSFDSVDPVVARGGDSVAGVEHPFIHRPRVKTTHTRKNGEDVRGWCRFFFLHNCHCCFCEVGSDPMEKYKKVRDLVDDMAIPYGIKLTRGYGLLHQSEGRTGVEW